MTNKEILNVVLNVFLHTMLVITAFFWAPVVIMFYMLPPVWVYYLIKWAVRNGIREGREY